MGGGQSARTRWANYTATLASRLATPKERYRHHTRHWTLSCVRCSRAGCGRRASGHRNGSEASSTRSVVEARVAPVKVCRAPSDVSHPPTTLKPEAIAPRKPPMPPQNRWYSVAGARSRAWPPARGLGASTSVVGITSTSSGAESSQSAPESPGPGFEASPHRTPAIGERRLEVGCRRARSPRSRWSSYLSSPSHVTLGSRDRYGLPRLNPRTPVSRPLP